MNWHPLIKLEQLDEIDNISKSQKVLIFKHSTRCSISSMALHRLESKWDDHKGIKAFYLDLLNYRDISNAISERYKVTHQSPQALLISNGQCIMHQSHSAVNAGELQNN